MSSSQKSNFSLVVYISRTKAKKNGEVPVLMKININGDRVVLQLQRSIQPKDWDSKRAKVIGRSHEAREFNDYIDSVYATGSRVLEDVTIVVRKRKSISTECTTKGAAIQRN